MDRFTDSIKLIAAFFADNVISIIFILT